MNGGYDVKVAYDIHLPQMESRGFHSWAQTMRNLRTALAEAERRAEQAEALVKSNEAREEAAWADGTQQLATLRADLENCHQQDRLKTKEINVLTAEARRLREALEEALEWAVEYFAGQATSDDAWWKRVPSTPATQREVERVRAMERFIQKIEDERQTHAHAPGAFTEYVLDALAAYDAKRDTP